MIPNRSLHEKLMSESIQERLPEMEVRHLSGSPETCLVAFGTKMKLLQLSGDTKFKVVGKLVNAEYDCEASPSMTSAAN
jgi:hypothetical protein